MNLTELLQSLSAHDSNTFVGFKVLTTEIMKGILSWYVTPYIMVGVRRHFGGTYCSHLRLPPTSCLAYSSIMNTDVVVVQVCSSETTVNFSRLHGFTSQKRAFFSCSSGYEFRRSYKTYNHYHKIPPLNCIPNQFN